MPTPTDSISSSYLPGIDSAGILICGENAQRLMGRSPYIWFRVIMFSRDKGNIVR